jgi:hypothetical protein
MKVPKPFPLLLVVLFSLLVGFGHAQESGQETKIQYLISSVEALKGAKFIRNGSDYDAKAAADHLRLKLKAAGSRVKTAEDFIRLCASRSSVSGAPYRIRFSDGTTTEAEIFFRKALARLGNNAVP